MADLFAAIRSPAGRDSPAVARVTDRFAVSLVASAMLLMTGCTNDRLAHSAGDPRSYVMPSLRDVIARTAPAVVAIGSDAMMLGSGFRLEGTPYVATAFHVVKSLKTAPRITWQGQSWTGKVAAIDDASDVALIEVPGDVPIPGLRLTSTTSSIASGDWILVLGCPFGRAPTATTGIISAVPGAIPSPANLATKIQLNAAVNPGNSGGPVVNLSGEVIGIANATIPGGFGLGFAVPVEALRALLEHADSGT